jgi:cytidine deaminase
MADEPSLNKWPSPFCQSPSMPERGSYESIWFPPGFVKAHCDPKSLVRGLPLPDTLRVPICPEHITHTITSELGALTRDLAHHYKVSSFTTLLSDQGQLFFGMPRNHAHPNCYGHSVECATGIAVTSGHHSFPLVVTYEKDPHRPPFDGLVLERLAEHFVPGCARKMRLLHVSDVGETIYEHNALLPFPHGGISRPHVSPRPSSAHKKLDFSLSADDVCNLQIGRNTLLAIGRELRAIVHNSSADGETRPGRKRHAACVFTADGDVYFGVNLRADVRAADRCAEWNALSAALVGGDKERIAGVMVYSPDYEEGSVCCCGKCLNSLGDFIDPNIGDMMIAYMGRTSIDALKLYTEVKNTSYGEAEGRSLRR